MYKDRKGSRDSGERPGRRHKKRKFAPPHELDTEYTNTSAQKLASSSDFSPPVTLTTAYVILHFFNVFSALSNILKCKTCNGPVQFGRHNQQGLGFQLSVNCDCGEQNIYSCPRIDNKSYEINRKMVFVMRILGVGLRGLNCFCSLMELGKGFTNKMFYAALENIHIACISVFASVIRKAGEEEKTQTAEAGDKFTVSGDGSWSKRGHTANYGVTTLIGNQTNKVLDLTVRSRYCQGCNSMKGKKNTVEYDLWMAEHEPVCALNHDGSSGKMEVDGMIDMFERAVDVHGEEYMRYIGDGDVKVFPALAKLFPNLVKAECINHVNKRMGSQLRGVIKNNKKEDEENDTGKSTGAKKKRNTLGGAGPGKLTGNLINEITIYYGLAIRRNVDCAEKMKEAIWAIYYHKISTDDKPQHQNCPEGPDSWCKWRRAEATNTLADFHHKPPLDPKVQTAIYPVFVKLTSDDLLQKCEGGYTQNNNESFNATIWQFAQKHVYCGLQVIEISAYMAACIFNEGFNPILKIMQIMGIEVGPNSEEFARERDADRVQGAERSMIYNTKEARSERKKAKADQEAQFELVEGIVYGPGIDV